MFKLVLLRHGESVWNKENLFTGWTDVGLSEKGVQEAMEGGRQLRKDGFVFDVAYTSVLKRAIKTLWLALEELDQMYIPIHNTWRLNERHYGALQGLNKKETAERFGLEQVTVWRRSYATPPDPVALDDPNHPVNDPRYANVSLRALPATECLADVVKRFVPYFEDVIVPELYAGRTPFVVAHGNSLRALRKYLEDMSEDEIVATEMPTGIPFVYELGDDLSVKSARYLGDPDAVAAAAEAVRRQAG